mmetsp:Transcript_45100/g.107220  ORF Transcript_45100/g.107220 Transcript_45100/m.107220 type:complete len:222 (+) Transcript_45100:76-741(+)
MSSSSWEPLKVKAKSLKTELDAKLHELGRLQGRFTGSSASTTSNLESQIQLVAGLQQDIEQGLSELSETSEALMRVAATTAQTHQAASIRETHQEIVRDFKRVSQSIDHAYQHSRLLPKRGAQKTGGDAAEEALMKERHALNSTLSMTDDIIGQASETRDMLLSQRAALSTISTKVGGLAANLPSIDQLIGKIGDRQARERLVLASTVAGCIIFTIWYKMF